MEEAQMKILEKILTLNVNTNINVQSIIEKYITFITIGSILETFIIGIFILIISYMLFKLIKDSYDDGKVYILDAVGLA